VAQGIEYHVRAILSVQKTGAGSKLKDFASSITSAADRLQSAGSKIAGDLGGVAKNLAGIGAAAATGLATWGVVAGIKEAIHLNADLEASTFSVASTLQLMSRNGGDFAKNMAEGQWIMDELFERAATSPASFDQAKTLFANMLPGAAQVTQDMERILDMGEAALTLGIQMGGDFKQAGADLRRIITGQAGADVRAWVEGLRTPIQELAAEKFGMKQTGDKFVQAFNKMDPEKRFQLVEEAVMRLGPATEAAGLMWAGLTSTVESDVQLLLREMGRATFEGIKERLIPLVSKGGLLDPKGETMGKLKKMAGFIGYKLAGVVDRIIAKLEEWVAYLADNWGKILDRMGQMWDKALRVAKILAAVAVTRKVAGAGLMAGGAAAKMGAGAAGAAQGVATALNQIGVAGIFAAPILLTAGLLLGGVAVAFGGVVAYFIQNWEDIIKAIQDGTVQLGPLFDAIDLLWVKLVDAGQAFMGASDPADATAKGVNAFTEGLYGLMGIMSLMLRVVGWLQQGWLIIKDGILGVYLGLVGMVQGIIWLLKEAVAMLPDRLAERMGIDKLNSAYDSVANHSQTVVAGLKDDAATFFDNRWHNAADAFDQAFVDPGKGVTSGLREELQKWAQGEGGRKEGGPGSGGSQAKGTPKNVTNIHKLVINQDLRGSDPDRVIGAFYKELDKTVRQRSQPLTSVDSGI
jgi:hypothetical protein